MEFPKGSLFTWGKLHSSIKEGDYFSSSHCHGQCYKNRTKSSGLIGSTGNQ